MTDKVDKSLAIHFLTAFEKQLVEIRTKMAKMKQVDTVNFTEFEKMLISTALNFGATMQLINQKMADSQKTVAEAKKWWMSPF